MTEHKPERAQERERLPEGERRAPSDRGAGEPPAKGGDERPPIPEEVPQYPSRRRRRGK